MLKTILSLLFISLSSLTFAQSQRLTGEVVRIADGDTFTLLDTSKKQIKVRFYGIDCPEKGQDFYQVAKDFVSEHCFRKQVQLDVKHIDRYGRTVAVVYINGMDLNLALLRAGLAWHYLSFDKSKEYADAQRSAQERQLKIWSIRTAIAPWEFRKQQKKQRNSPSQQGKTAA